MAVHGGTYRIVARALAGFTAPGALEFAEAA
jgi:hypothetical protein